MLRLGKVEISAEDECRCEIDELIGSTRRLAKKLLSEKVEQPAARAGTSTPFNTGKCLSTEQANYNGNYPLSGCSKGQYREKTI